MQLKLEKWLLSKRTGRQNVFRSILSQGDECLLLRGGLPGVSAKTELCIVCPSVPALLPARWPGTTCDSLCDPAGIMLGRMGDSGTPLVSFCQCLNESVMKIVAVAGW